MGLGFRVKGRETLNPVATWEGLTPMFQRLPCRRHLQEVLTDPEDSLSARQPRTQKGISVCGRQCSGRVGFTF